MVFAHDTVEALEAAAFLANSELDPDTLTTFDDLVNFFDTFRYSGPRPLARDLREVREIRSRLRGLFKATRNDAVPLVNEILAEKQALPQVVRHDERDWHIHAASDDRPYAERILVETAMAIIDVIRADEFQRFGRCEMEDCAGVVIDLSRNRSRKYCSVTCTNRASQAAFRARQAEAEELETA
ncbi:CGNR zinc finger domain-containing protein [Demequina sp.]|uniref:CGNR zinc finger domain-containing protein n=1 Tax=Demequina sp. TaxID=2050685 RepID=UPI003A839753